MRVLSLFSGGGLGDYGLTLAGMEIVGQVEIDEYCQKILKLRWPDVPKWMDIREVKGAEVIEKCGAVDLVSGGFPCQDISIAGKHIGIEGERSGLWKEYFRLVCEIRPRFVFVENVSMLLSRGLGVVLGDLARGGYCSEWICLPASFFGHLHGRNRVWIIAYPESLRRKHSGNEKDNRVSRSRRVFNKIPIKRVSSGDKERFFEKVRASEFIRNANGTPNRVDRLKCLGNGQVVQVVEWIGTQIMTFNRLGNVRND
jgi:DNA (cytosine-5)-methyltransferase 1